MSSAGPFIRLFNLRGLLYLFVRFGLLKELLDGGSL